MSSFHEDHLALQRIPEEKLREKDLVILSIAFCLLQS